MGFYCLTYFIWFLSGKRRASLQLFMKKLYDFNSAACKYAIHLNIRNCVAFLLVQISNDNNTL